MTSQAAETLCDATAMIRFHRIFRQAFAAVPELIQPVEVPDRARTDQVGSYYANVLKLLHAHHEGEDLTIYPWMLERLPEHAEVLEAVNAEHETVLGALNTAEAALEAWQADASAASRDACVAGLKALDPILFGHLDHEEEAVVPLIALCITQADWGELSATAFAHFRGDKPWLAIGLIQEQMLPHENEMMEANMPPPVHDFWVGSGRGMYEGFVAELRR